MFNEDALFPHKTHTTQLRWDGSFNGSKLSALWQITATRCIWNHGNGNYGHSQPIGALESLTAMETTAICSHRVHWNHGNGKKPPLEHGTPSAQVRWYLKQALQP